MATPLTEVQIAEIREIFTLLDKNSDGLVNTNQLGMILQFCIFYSIKFILNCHSQIG